MINPGLIDAVQNNWGKVYWFARMLINQDKYGGIGGENELVSSIASSLRVVEEENDNLGALGTLKLQKRILRNILEERFANAPSRIERVKNLIEDLGDEIQNSTDMEVFIITCENIMLPQFIKQ